MREPIHGQFHGKTGLGNTTLPDPVKKAEDMSAVDFLIETLGKAAESGERITLCCLGPMTNVAVALRMKPGLADGIERIVHAWRRASDDKQGNAIDKGTEERHQ